MPLSQIKSTGGGAFAFQADAANPESQRAGVKQAAAALGGIDILVHNAGVAEFSAVAEDTDEAFDRQFGVNVKGLHVGTRAARPHLSAGGRIILIGSVSGELAFPSTVHLISRSSVPVEPTRSQRPGPLPPEAGRGRPHLRLDLAQLNCTVG